MHACMHTYIQTYMHAYIHTYIHTFPFASWHYMCLDLYAALKLYRPGDVSTARVYSLILQNHKQLGGEGMIDAVYIGRTPLVRGPDGTYECRDQSMESR